jgi:hypothetical protein
MIWRVGDCHEAQLRTKRDPSTVLQVRVKKRSSSVRLLIEAFGVVVNQRKLAFLWRTMWI